MCTVVDLGGASPLRRQKSPFALLNYSFTVANDASLYPLSIHYAAHCIDNAIQSINSSVADC